MRLIDVSDLEKFIQENVCAIGNNHLLLVAGDDGGWHEALPLVKTAYDVDKVVEELEKAKHEIASEDYCRSINDKEKCDGRNCFKCCAEYLIEIVKQCSVSDDVCEWKSASDGEFIQNPHTNRLHSNEPSMKNVYCNTCGKKIKVVE